MTCRAGVTTFDRIVRTASNYLKEREHYRHSSMDIDKKRGYIGVVCQACGCIPIQIVYDPNTRVARIMTSNTQRVLGQELSDVLRGLKVASLVEVIERCNWGEPICGAVRAAYER